MKGMHPLFKKWLTIFLVVLLIGVLGAGLAVGALIGYLESMPPITRLENYNPPEISRVYDRTGNKQIGQFSPKEKRELVRIKEIPEHVQQAFLAIEDERFYHHFGVDLKGIVRAIVENFRSGGKAQGASTITMQVARNVVLEDSKKNFMRKFKEMLISLQMERDFSKDQILEFYLNHIFFGANAYGIQQASWAYFSKDVKDLNTQEAALLAGLPKAPSTLSPLSSFNNKENTMNRRNQVLYNMWKVGFIKKKTEYDRLAATPLELNPPPAVKTTAPYFVSYVSNNLLRKTNLKTQADLGSKAFQVISTVDLELQKICEEELSKALRDVEIEAESQKEARLAAEEGGLAANTRHLARITEVGKEYIRVSVKGASARVPLPEKLPFFFPEKVIKKGGLVDVYVASMKGKNGGIEAYLWDKSHVQGAAVLLNNKTGEILAMVGGDDFNDKNNNGEYNRAFQGGSQPGSCWKPLLYGGALDIMEDGKPKWTPGTVIMDEPFSIGSWAPKNYENRHYGSTSFFEALVHSRNVPTVKLFQAIGGSKSVDIYNSFNMVYHPSNWEIPKLAPVSLGTQNVTALELAAAYAVFANHGTGITPSPVKRLFSSKSASDSKVIKPEEYQVLTPQAAYMMCRILEDVITQGTAKNSIGKWLEDQKASGRKMPEMAGKTGTTNDCFNAWFCGFTPDVTLVINIGYDQPHSLGPKMTGGKVVGPIWTAIMDRVLKSRTDWQLKFSVPSGIAFRDICSRSGELVTGSCSASGDDIFKNAAFKSGTEPNSSCSFHGGRATRSEASVADPEAQYNMPEAQRSMPPSSQPSYQQY